MPDGGRRLRFALDHNFPSPALSAFGLLLCHLNHICHHTQPDRAQVWILRVAQKNYEEPRAYLERLADKRGTTAEEIVPAHKLPKKDLQRAKA
jgi:hypothetical protein